ncbi:hypothetical protein J31TS4_30120 [Paenibacillus sp. J31TS4]|uniref:DUF2304 domain-containing protein n=1 Tax=Paenibacillus sp. J31TS4 TaxID=2807195 RepID=UPI001B09A3D6|nr:DUF2304 domain-containing protein [Paenibacillus sp. J31TS4]GIP39732.1 hypothetical protein J31TS4_30120 [Paenibacillus sp. J31TS4]
MNIYLLAVVFCLLFLGITVELIRRQKMAERYAIIWLLLGVLMLVFSVFPSLLDRVSALLHIYYAPSFLFFIGLTFSMVIILHLTIVVTRLNRQVTRLIQELALLKAQNKEETSDDRPAHRTG